MNEIIASSIAKFLHHKEIKKIFTVTGGGAMFLNDAFGNTPGIQPIYCHHEQACTMAAEGYARLTGKPGIAVVTTGPGGINALNGVFGAWTDSIPMLILSGQVKRQTCLASYDLPNLRQLGDQEADIVSMVRAITKYAVVVTDPTDIRYHLEKALYLATHGRPGPVWLDIPIDVQSAMVDPETLRGFDPSELPPSPTLAAQELRDRCAGVLDKLIEAKRPVLMAGSGVRIGNAIVPMLRVAERLGIPVVTAWTHDLIASDHPLYCGRPGTIGTRAGNFTVQNADLLLVLGSRLNIRQTSYNWQSFAENAFRIQVDIDPAELEKPTLKVEQAICADVREFLQTLDALIPEEIPNTQSRLEWLATCRHWLEKYLPVQPRQREWQGKINPYAFIEQLGKHLDADDIVVCGNATACIVPYQALPIKAGQRMFSNSGSASMGYDLPAAIGAWFGALASRGKQKRIVCLAGDGSIMMNLQELQTIAHHRLPIKIFVLDNNGYLSIRTSQTNFFKRVAGESPESGVSFPDFVAVAMAFGIPASRIEGQPELETAIQTILDADGPYLAQVILDPNQQFEPRMSSRQLEDGQIVSASLEDMYPFLSREELASNMLNCKP